MNKETDKLHLLCSWEHTGKAVHLYEPCKDNYGAPVRTDGCYIALFLNPPAPLYSYKVCLQACYHTADSEML
jgi:hypothetical protein